MNMKVGFVYKSIKSCWSNFSIDGFGLKLEYWCQQKSLIFRMIILKNIVNPVL